MVRQRGLEPPTRALKVLYSTTELLAQMCSSTSELHPHVELI